MGKFKNEDVETFLRRNKACSTKGGDALRWARKNKITTMHEAWERAPRGGWLSWVLSVLGDERASLCGCPVCLPGTLNRLGAKPVRSPPRDGASDSGGRAQSVPRAAESVMRAHHEEFSFLFWFIQMFGFLAALVWPRFRRTKGDE